MTALVHRSAIKIGPTSPLDMNERQQGSRDKGRSRIRDTVRGYP